MDTTRVGGIFDCLMLDNLVRGGGVGVAKGDLVDSRRRGVFVYTSWALTVWAWWLVGEDEASSSS